MHAHTTLEHIYSTCAHLLASAQVHTHTLTHSLIHTLTHTLPQTSIIQFQVGNPQLFIYGFFFFFASPFCGMHIGAADERECKGKGPEVGELRLATV